MWPARPGKTTMADIRILDNGLRTEGDRLRYAFFRLETPEGERVRCVALKELAYIPVEAREDPDVLGKQWAAVRGLYNAGVEALYLAAGIFTPRRLGIVQFYGAAAEAAAEEAAAQEALRRMATVEAVLANFPQTRLAPPDLERVEWLVDFLATAPHLQVILGHPDPRQARRGLGRDGALGEADEDLASQQNEMLFRGLARLREDFVFLVMAQHVGRRRLTEGLVRVAEAASQVASRRRGSLNVGFSISLPLLAAIGGVHGGTAAGAHGATRGASEGVSEGWGRSHVEGQAHTEMESVSHTTGRTWSRAVGESEGVAQGRSTMEVQGSGQASGRGASSGSSFMIGESRTLGGSFGVELGFKPAGVGLNADMGAQGSRSWSHAAGTFQSTSTFQSQSTFQSHGEGTFESQSRATSEVDVEGGFSATTRSRGTADTVSRAEGISQSWGRSHAETRAESDLTGRAGSQAFIGAFSGGVAPGVSIGRTWQTEDDVAERLTEVLRGLEALLNQAGAEGGFMTDAYLLTRTPTGARAGAALVPQAFHGPSVPTPVLTVPAEGPEADHVRLHAMALRPCEEAPPGDPFGGYLWRSTSTLLTAGQLAALTAPGLFEEGLAVTVQERLPPLGFYPDMPGEVTLGHQYSAETGDLTDVPVRLTRSRHFHTAFTGDTGYGKSVAAMRLAYESTLHWRLRTIVLDFGAGWRALLNAPGLEGRVDIYQLWPGAGRPFRWNPLQIGTNIAPEVQWRAFCDIFGAIARLGVRRQVGELRDALRQVYLAAGVLVDDPEVRQDPEWGKVLDREREIARPGTPLGDLDPETRQRLAVERSKAVGLSDLYALIEQKLRDTPPRDTMLRGVLEGILYRMHPLVWGAAASQYAPGPDSLPLEDLARPWGICILEGGAFLDEFSKAFLLGWAAWHIYTDSVVRRIRRAAAPDEYLQIFFEEANKILSGVDYGGDEDGGGASYTAEQFANMWRDSRKYGVWLHVITQSPALIPPGILSSCDNLVACHLKNPKDRDLVVAAIARSEKGFVDETWRRFLARLAVGQAVCRLGYSPEMADLEPMLIRPLMLQVPEPTDEEIAARLGGRDATA